jgi:hypothetical protein
MGSAQAGVRARSFELNPSGLPVSCLFSANGHFSLWDAHVLKFFSNPADGLDKEQSGETMSISSISAAGLSEYVLSSGYSTQQQALRTLQNSLASGNLTSAQSAFQTLQSLFQNSATSTGSTLSSNSQLSTDLTALGSALSSGDLSTAQSAFVTVLSDLKSSASAAQVNEATAASQSLQLVDGILGTLNSSAANSSTANSSTVSSSSVDNTASILQSVYGSNGGLNVYA